jgi:hypothetical protein
MELGCVLRHLGGLVTQESISRLRCGQQFIVHCATGAEIEARFPSLGVAERGQPNLPTPIGVEDQRACRNPMSSL